MIFLEDIQLSLAVQLVPHTVTPLTSVPLAFKDLSGSQEAAGAIPRISIQIQVPEARQHLQGFGV